MSEKHRHERLARTSRGRVGTCERSKLTKRHRATLRLTSASEEKA